MCTIVSGIIAASTEKGAMELAGALFCAALLDHVDGRNVFLSGMIDADDPTVAFMDAVEKLPCGTVYVDAILASPQEGLYCRVLRNVTDWYTQYGRLTFTSPCRVRI